MTSDIQYGFNNTVEYVSPADLDFPEADEIGSVSPIVMRHENWHESDALMMVVIRHATTNERSGNDSIMDESNYRSLVRDFPYAFVRVSYSNCDGLATFAHILDHDEELRKVVVGLADEYPLYDESDWSELENEKKEESWDAYVWADLSSDVKNALDKELNREGNDDVWTSIDEWVDDSEDKMREVFFNLAYESGWEFSDASEWMPWADIWKGVSAKMTEEYVTYRNQ